MDVEIQLQKTKKIFVERIEVEGNSTTIDEVIRCNLTLQKVILLIDVKFLKL